MTYNVTWACSDINQPKRFKLQNMLKAPQGRAGNKYVLSTARGGGTPFGPISRISGLAYGFLSRFMFFLVSVIVVSDLGLLCHNHLFLDFLCFT